MRALPGLLRGMERARVSHHLELIFFSFLSFSLFPFFLMFLDSRYWGRVGLRHQACDLTASGSLDPVMIGDTEQLVKSLVK